jgi:hypothetical protein
MMKSVHVVVAAYAIRKSCFGASVVPARSEHKNNRFLLCLSSLDTCVTDHDN